MLVYRSTVAAALLWGSLLVGCADPEVPTDLRKDGPPNVTAVMVMSDLENAAYPSLGGDLGRIVETATYCRVNDDKRPGRVALPDIRAIQVCPDNTQDPAEQANLAEAAPPTWWVRIVFDRLLDPSIEDLMVGSNGITFGTFRNTQPVTLKCNGADVSYDGYYVPNGNRASWPLGPALYIQPTTAASVPTGASCTVSIKDNVHSKSEDSVPSDQRSYSFKLAPMKFLFSNPDSSDSPDGEFLQDPNTAVSFFFTAALQGTPVGTDHKLVNSMLDPAKVTIISGDNVGISAANPDGDANPDVCNGTGVAVDTSTIRTLVRGDVTDPKQTAAATTTALVLLIDVKGGAAPLATRWKPNTTYRITFAAGATVPSSQGGAAAFPTDYSLCFHTSAAPM